MEQFVFWNLVFLAGLQAVLGLHFALLLKRYQRPAVKRWPRVSVWLSLRGADPGLAENLRSLATQSYPEYELRVVVDSEHDPAWPVAQEALAGFPHARLEVLRQRLTSCSLKASALLQLAGSGLQNIEVVAFVDGDVAVSENWLKELVAPLSDPAVGVTFGNRWYQPAAGHWGSLVRYLWNAVAVVPMYLHGMPWGGSLAMSTQVLGESGLLHKWSLSLSTDAPIKSAVVSLGKKVRFVPSLMMKNDEECDLSHAFDFIPRQLGSTRLYHPHWPAILMHAVYTTLLISAAFILTVWGETWWPPGGLILYLGSGLLLLMLLESVLGGKPRSFGMQAHWKLVPAILLAQLTHLAATVRAHFRRRVCWRGVSYRIDGPWSVELEDDVHFQAPGRSGNRSLS